MLVAIDEDTQSLRNVERELIDRCSRSYRVVCIPSAEEASAELFLMIGARPNTGWLPAGLARDDGGFIRTGAGLEAERGRLRSGSSMNSSRGCISKIIIFSIA